MIAFPALVALVVALMSLRDMSRPRSLIIINVLIIALLVYFIAITLGPPIADTINDSRVAQCPPAKVVPDETFGINFGKRCDDPSVNPVGAKVVTLLSSLMPDREQQFGDLGRFVLAILGLLVLSIIGFIMELSHRKKSGQSMWRALWSPSFPALLSMILPFLVFFTFTSS